jgi:hypothetical protein
MYEQSPKLFYLKRNEDVTGMTGEGKVAWGCMFPNGKCVLSWLSYYSAIGVYENIQQLETIHSHGGTTEIVWIDS